MKTFIKLFSLVICLTLVIAMAVSCKKDDNKPNYDDYQGTGGNIDFVGDPNGNEEINNDYIGTENINDEQGWGPIILRP